MGLSQSVATEIEINASPEHVRSVFMDFARFKDWSQWTVDTNKTPSDLKPSDTISVNLKGLKFSPEIKANTSDLFSWDGGFYPLFAGKHDFYWKPSQITPGGTTMVQSEVFRGILAFLLAPWSPFRRQTLENWDEFFVDLKREAERTA